MPTRVYKLSYGFVQHALLLSRFIAFANYWSRQQEAYTLVACRLSYELARHRALTTMTLQGKTVSVIPDAFVCFERVADGNRFNIIFETDCGTESSKKFRQHVSNRLVYLQSPQYKALAKTYIGRVCYLTIGQVPRYKESRRRAMQRITHDVLAELEMPEWSSVFLFASVDYKRLFQSDLLDQSEWYHPNSQTSVSLLPPVAGDVKE